MVWVALCYRFEWVCCRPGFLAFPRPQVVLLNCCCTRYSGASLLGMYVGLWRTCASICAQSYWLG